MRTGLGTLFQGYTFLLVRQERTGPQSMLDKPMISQLGFQITIGWMRLSELGRRKYMRGLSTCRLNEIGWRDC
ncbi:MAG: hypothetical protein CMQ43_05995 [Gammaproteobacteria bacterium]|nr:hypothetical protein [Gammaproteobacteria bacterium]